MFIQRIGTAIGTDKAGERRAVSVYRDGNGFKLSGKGGSHLIPAVALDAALAAVSEHYALSNIEYHRSVRAA